MSISSLVQVFEAGARTSVGPHQSSLEFQELVRHYLEVAENEVVSQDAVPPSKPRTLISETGHYLVQVARILGNLTEGLVQGPHAEAAIIAEHERSHINTKTADINDIAKMDVECIKLREIDELAQKFSRDVRDVWNAAGPPIGAVGSQSSPSASSPFGETKRLSTKQSPSIAGDVDIKLHSTQHTLPSPQMPPGFTASTPNASGSDESSEEDERFSNIDMDALRQRGKGSYYCPLGVRCKKGGVDKDGRPIRFDRNSSFAQHCNKHRKPWRCDIPGCPNPPKKRKFARRDGLDRHKATVKHGPPK